MTAPLSPVDYLRSINPEAAEAFQALRRAAVKGPLEEKVYEFAVVAALATSGEEGSFKVHARRLRRLGASVEEVRQATLATLAASTTFSQAVEALRWIDAVYMEPS
jgi:alkylhydroperoxidase/carboxymuconolactone decarboxylase family protein YurZ